MKEDTAQGSRWDIEFFETSSGRCPTAEFLEALPPHHKERVLRALGRLEEHGELLDRPHVGYLRDRIRELRITAERIQYRILFFRDRSTYVMCQGFPKTARRVKDSEIDEAIEYRKEYFRGKEIGAVR
jgi:phage-related protein